MVIANIFKENHGKNILRKAEINIIVSSLSLELSLIFMSAYKMKNI